MGMNGWWVEAGYFQIPGLRMDESEAEFAKVMHVYQGCEIIRTK